MADQIRAALGERDRLRAALYECADRLDEAWRCVPWQLHPKNVQRIMAYAAALDAASACGWMPGGER